MVKVQPGHCPSSAPVPRQGAPDGLGPLGPLGAPRERPAHWAPRHGLEGSSSPPPGPPISSPFFISLFFLCHRAGRPPEERTRRALDAQPPVERPLAGRARKEAPRTGRLGGERCG